jgi:hypothetical protein
LSDLATRLAGGVAGVALGLLLFLGQLLARLAVGALLRLESFLGFEIGGHAGGVLLGLFTALLGLGQLVLLAQGLLFGGALFSQAFEFRVGGGGLRLEFGEQGLFGLLLGGNAVGNPVFRSFMRKRQGSL